MAPAEPGEHLPRVIADRRQSDAFLSQFIDATLQLDELRAAVGSPVGRSQEDKHQPTFAHERLECSDTPVLVREAEVGNAFPDLGPPL
jgi:hypothetical protein